MAPLPRIPESSDYKSARNALLNDIVPMESNGTSKLFGYHHYSFPFLFLHINCATVYRLSIQDMLLFLLFVLLLHLL